MRPGVAPLAPHYLLLPTFCPCAHLTVVVAACSSLHHLEAQHRCHTAQDGRLAMPCRPRLAAARDAAFQQRLCGVAASSLGRKGRAPPPYSQPTPVQHVALACRPIKGHLGQLPHEGRRVREPPVFHTASRVCTREGRAARQRQGGRPCAAGAHTPPGKPPPSLHPASGDSPLTVPPAAGSRPDAGPRTLRTSQRRRSRRRSGPALRRPAAWQTTWGQAGEAREGSHVGKGPLQGSGGVHACTGGEALTLGWPSRAGPPAGLGTCKAAGLRRGGGEATPLEVRAERGGGGRRATKQAVRCHPPRCRTHRLWLATAAALAQLLNIVLSPAVQGGVKAAEHRAQGGGQQAGHLPGRRGRGSGAAQESWARWARRGEAAAAAARVAIRAPFNSAHWASRTSASSSTHSERSIRALSAGSGSSADGWGSGSEGGGSARGRLRGLMHRGSAARHPALLLAGLPDSTRQVRPGPSHSLACWRRAAQPPQTPGGGAS